ncbi:MAG: hypothetical protein V1934_00045 [Methanobacteriota archaeon]
MTSELSRKLQNVMSREMGQLGKFIVQKQCKDLGIDSEEIKPENLPQLAKAFSKVMVTFGGEAKAQNIEREIRKLAG